MGFQLQGERDRREFRDDAGFVPRNDIVEARFANRLTYYGKRGATIETATVFFNPNRIWRMRILRASPIEGADSVNMNATLRKGWQASASLAASSGRSIRPRTPATQSSAPAGRWRTMHRAS